MATLAANRIPQTSGGVVGNEQAMATTAWGIDGSGVLNNSTIFLPTVAGTLNYLVRQEAAGVWSYVNPAGVDTSAIHTNIAGEINGLTEKVTPVSGDWVIIEDSADSNNKKKVDVSSFLGGGGGSPGGSDG